MQMRKDLFTGCLFAAACARVPAQPRFRALRQPMAGIRFPVRYFAAQSTSLHLSRVCDRPLTREGIRMPAVINEFDPARFTLVVSQLTSNIVGMSPNLSPVSV